jgi:hypothetical protein
MQIKVRLKNNQFEVVPGPERLGMQTAFWDDLLHDSAPLNPPKILGEHSGSATLIRFEAGGEWFQYQATYRLDPTPGVQEGQVTARGLVFFREGDFVGGPRVAITGGTDAYKNARGQVTWTLVTPPEKFNRHTLDIVL